MSERQTHNAKIEEILSTIAADFELALISEREFVDWERDHRGADFQEFAERFARWVDASEPFVRKYHTIEEYHPVFSDRMYAVLSPVRLRFEC
jgi:hypothetical protein